MTDNDNTDEDPKIIVDDDWKEQVAKEKTQSSEGDDFVAKPNEVTADDDGQLPPPASFEVLVTMLFTQAMSMLGQFPNPASGENEVNKPLAKHFIDTMEVLDEKTKGNLTDSEAAMLSEAMHALRMTYVNAKA